MLPDLVHGILVKGIDRVSDHFSKNFNGLSNSLSLDQLLSGTDVTRRLSSVEIRKRCLLLTERLLGPRKFGSVTVARQFHLLRFEAFLLVLLLVTRGNFSSFFASLNSSASSCAPILQWGVFLGGVFWVVFFKGDFFFFSRWSFFLGEFFFLGGVFF